VRKVSGGPTIERKAAVPTARLELLLGFAIGKRSVGQATRVTQLCQNLTHD